jgi:hypothetical protein
VTDTRQVETWRRLVTDQQASWVLFRHSTCVVVSGDHGDVQNSAVERLRRLGQSVAGTASADFAVVPLDGEPGWVVTSSDELVHTYVHPDEMGQDISDVDVGLVGRHKRDCDVAELDVVHVEDRRELGR